MANRIAVVDRKLCKSKKCGYQCAKVCPVNRSGEECISVDSESRFPVVNESICIGCGLCVHRCEKINYNAISVVNLPKELEESPIHRYGVNMFGLFRLPVPKRNMVVGLVGPNGVGKSTVLNILSGDMKPNTGLLDSEASWGEIISRFRGTELQEYLEMLSRGGVKACHKPQGVDMIPGMWKGKVSAMLRKADSGKLKGVVERLRMEEMMGKDIASLSGGELQLLAVAATLVKEGDFYFFDEPSSYLDVRERLLVAREIRRLAEERVVMVVEHDLAIADYLADHVHILYGKPAVFGVVSKPYGVRVGINTYLEGYIKEENVRFREEPIIFRKSAKPSVKSHMFLEFPEFEKGFKDFSLKTRGGELHRGEMIGILGPNSIGKTTFIKMLAGEVKPDKGKALGDFELSYKPQRLILSDKEKGMMVSRFLKGGGSLGKDVKKVVSLLGVGKLMEREVGSLSGGELQAVFIISALAKPHDMLLLDEPSAFLDVEQRLKIAKILRNWVEEKEIPGFVVEHDLQVMDAVADRVMVFSGEPGVKGFGNPPLPLRDGMNMFLKDLDVTFRKDPITWRPRANKPGSQKDAEQKKSGEYYYQ